MFEGLGNKKIAGALFPILPEHITNLFDNDRDVFVKFTILNSLTNGSIIVFYVSREKILIGEGKIKKIEKMAPETAWFRYGKRLFLEREEYDFYSKYSTIDNKERKMKEITVFTLNKIKRYKYPIKSIYKGTPSGRYLTIRMINKIRMLTSANIDINNKDKTL